MEKTISKRRMKMKELKTTLEGFYVTEDEDSIIREAAKKRFQTKSGFLRQTSLEKAKDVLGRID